MNIYDLSVLIPARNEIFLSRTVDDLLKNIRGKTEIIIVLDGAWSNPGVVDDERVTIIYHNQSIGQRAATNEACKLSKAKYVMKLDAHCAVDEGFDVKLMADMKDNWTVVPLMRNLHVFDWVCDSCKHRIYQGPTPEKCPKCGATMQKEILWKAKESPKSTAFRFDKTLHFQYFPELKKRLEGTGMITPTLSIQGSCFMLTREKYWELNICDEAHGSWGQQGVEVALKTWMSGGEVICNQNTWYAHMFRTQGGDFGFPYPLSGKEVDRARKYSRELFLEGKWDRAKYSLQEVLDKFAPVPDWHDPKDKTKVNVIVKKPKKGIVYYTHNVGDEALLKACRRQIARGMKEKHIVSMSSLPIEFGNNIVFPRVKASGWLDIFSKIIVGLENSKADIIFFTEHDVFYHPKHFDFIPPRKDMYYYNTNVWRVRSNDGFALRVNGLRQLSGLVAYRDLLLKHYEERIKKIVKSGFSFDMGFEPGTHGREARVDDIKAQNYEAVFPNIDIRHETNATASRWTKEEFRNQKYTEGWTESHFTKIPGWKIDFSKLFPDNISSI